jgi:hypothetical protein
LGCKTAGERGHIQSLKAQTSSFPGGTLHKGARNSLAKFGGRNNYSCGGVNAARLGMRRCLHHMLNNIQKRLSERDFKMNIMFFLSAGCKCIRTPIYDLSLRPLFQILPHCFESPFPALPPPRAGGRAEGGRQCTSRGLDVVLAWLTQRCWSRSWRSFWSCGPAGSS